VAAFAALKSKVFSGEAFPSPVWEITHAKGQSVEGEFTDGYALNSVRVRAKDGFNLLRVTGRIKNISDQSDPAYVKWVLSTPDFANHYTDDRMSVFVDKVPEPNRLADDDFLFLLTPGGDLIGSTHVCQNGLPQQSSGNVSNPYGQITATFFTGKFVEKGTEFQLDVIFQVPKDIKTFKLIMLGSRAVPVALTN